MTLNISDRGILKIEIDGSDLITSSWYMGRERHSLIGITEIDCQNNRLQELPVFPEGLKVLQCSKNALRSLPKLPDSLQTLYCYHNKLISIIKLPLSLIRLGCAANDSLVFIAPLPNKITMLMIPDHLTKLHQTSNHSRYQRQYSTYKYLITFLTLTLGVFPMVVTNDLWLFWKK